MARFLRRFTSDQITRAEIEIVTSVINGRWLAAYGNYEHEKIGEEAGHLPPEKVEALIAGLPTSFIAALERGEPAVGLSSQEQLAQRFAREITAKRRVGDALYDEAYATFGPQGLVDLLFLAGCYHTIALLLNTFAVPVPA